MKPYKVLKTTEGHKYKVLLSEDEQAERELYWLTVAVLPFMCGLLMAVLWFTGV